MEERWRFVRQLMEWHDLIWLALILLTAIGGIVALILNPIALIGRDGNGLPANYSYLALVALPFDIMFFLGAVPLCWYFYCYMKYEAWPDFVRDANRIAGWKR